MLFTTPQLAWDETAVIEEIDRLRENFGYAVRTPPRWYGLLRRNIFARNVRASNTIEGHNVTLDDAVAAVESEEPFEAKGVDWAAVVGYRQAMTYVLQLAKRQTLVYSSETLRALHYMMLSYDLGKLPGNWRAGPISIHDSERREVVYEGPDAELVSGLVEELVTWLNHEDELSPFVRAAMAHLNLVMIHPFSDGNGRMGRCLQSLVLARGSDRLDPNFVSIEDYLGENAREYYDALAAVGQERWNPKNDTRPWLRFCLTAHYRQAMSVRRRMRNLHRLWDALEQETDRRGLPERTTLALVEAAQGFRVRNAIYRKAVEISGQLASRDLTALVRMGLLEMKGGGRGAHYVASPAVSEIAARLREPRKVEDPFELVRESRN